MTLQNLDGTKTITEVFAIPSSEYAIFREENGAYRVGNRLDVGISYMSSDCHQSFIAALRQAAKMGAHVAQAMIDGFDNRFGQIH